MAGCRAMSCRHLGRVFRVDLLGERKTDLTHMMSCILNTSLRTVNWCAPFLRPVCLPGHRILGTCNMRHSGVFACV
jgi:hypothetical protein